MTLRRIVPPGRKLPHPSIIELVFEIGKPVAEFRLRDHLRPAAIGLAWPAEIMDLEQPDGRRARQL